MNLKSVNLELDPEKKYDIFSRLRGKIFNYCERLKNSEAKLKFFKKILEVAIKFTWPKTKVGSILPLLLNLIQESSRLIFPL